MNCILLSVFDGELLIVRTRTVWTTENFLSIIYRKLQAWAGWCHIDDMHSSITGLQPADQSGSFAFTDVSTVTMTTCKSFHQHTSCSDTYYQAFNVVTRNGRTKPAATVNVLSLFTFVAWVGKTLPFTYMLSKTKWSYIVPVHASKARYSYTWFSPMH